MSDPQKCPKCGEDMAQVVGRGTYRNPNTYWLCNSCGIVYMLTPDGKYAEVYDLKEAEDAYDV